MKRAHDSDAKHVSEQETLEELRNEDPITRESGAHPVGTGVGAALGGAAAGAAAGALAGPAGAVVGAAVGAIVGGLGGKAVAESIDPTVELVYWESEFRNRHYYQPEMVFDDYSPAYRLVSERFNQALRFVDVEHDLKKAWTEAKGVSRLTWDQAKLAMIDAWDHLANRCCDKDGVCDTQKPR